MEINKIIKKRRLELGLTLKDIANALGIAESTVSRYESSDIQNMGIDKIEALAKVLECSPAYLMGWEGETTNKIPGQSSFFEIPLLSIENASIWENEIVNALRTLRNESSEEYEALCSIFARIPSLPKDLREDIFEYDYLVIKNYDKKQMQKHVHVITNNESTSADAYWDIISMDGGFETNTPTLNAAHERTDIEVTEDTKKHDDAIMNDEDF